MKRKRLKLAGVLIFIVLGISSFPFFCTIIEEEMDKWADPSYNGEGYWPRYDGGWFNFWVDKDFPYSKVAMYKYSDNRSLVVESALHTDPSYEVSIGGKNWWLIEEVDGGPDIYEKIQYRFEWWILNYTIVYHDFNWTFFDGEEWIEEPAWDYEFTNYHCVLNVTAYDIDYQEGNYCEAYNLTLYVEWYGYI